MPPVPTYNRFSDWQRSGGTPAVVTLEGAVTGTASASAGQDTAAQTTLSPVLSNPGSFGSASLSVNLKVNSAGQIVSVGESTITASGLSTAVTFSYTGDATGGPTSFDGKSNVTTALTLATVNADVGTFGDSTHVSRVTVDAKGRVTAASAVAIAYPPDTGITQLTGDGTAGPGSGSQALTFATVNSSVGSFTNANITVNAKGLITAASNGSGGGGGTVTAVSSSSADLTVATGTTTPVLTVNSAPKWTTARTLSYTGNVTGSGSVDGSGNVATALTIGALQVATGMLQAGAVTYAKIQNVSANSVLLGAGASGSGAAPVEITLGTNLSMTGTTLNATASGSGTVTSVSSTTGEITVANPTTTPALTIVSAPKLTTARTLSYTSDVTGTGSFDGSGNLATALTIRTDVALAGNPTTTTQSASDNSTRIATTAFTTTAIANAIAGVNPAVAVQAATTAASDTSGLTYNNGVSGVGATLTGLVNTALTVDGYTFTALAQRLLVKNDTQSPSGAFNGVYYVTQIQTALLPLILTRALDYDQPSDINNTGAIPVVNGTVNANTSWLLTSAVTTVGTNPLTYTQFSVAPSNVVQTGGSNPTNHGVVLGKGTNVIGSTAAGTSGQVLTSNGPSADPTFQAPPTITPQGRLSLVSATPVMTSDQTAKTTIYYAEYQGNSCPVYNGTNTVPLTFSNLSLILDTSSHLLNNVYDVFLYDSGSSTAAIGAGPAWVNTATVTWTSASPGVCTWTGHGLNEGAPVVFTAGTSTPTGITAGTTYFVSKTGLGVNSFSVSTTLANSAAGTNVNTSSTGSGTQTGTNRTTVRGTGAGTTELQLENGLLTNKNSVTLTNNSITASVAANKATYLGSFFCTANGQTGVAMTPAAAAGGSANVIGLWNAYNRVGVTATMLDSNATFTLSASATGAIDGVGTRISLLDGLAQSAVLATQFWNVNANGQFVIFGTTRNITTALINANAGTNGGGAGFTFTASNTFAPALGLSAYQCVYITGTGTSRLSTNQGALTMQSYY